MGDWGELWNWFWPIRIATHRNPTDFQPLTIYLPDSHANSSDKLRPFFIISHFAPPFSFVDKVEFLCPTFSIPCRKDKPEAGRGN